MKLIKRNSIPYIAFWLILTTVSITRYYVNPIFTLNENQILYLFSAASQVIAAIYGLIITGYIFLRNELDRKVEEDETFEEIISLLKNEYFHSIINISIVTIISISICFLVISDATSDNIEILNLLLNISVPTILTELILIVSFVIRILNPKSLELASNKLQRIITKHDKGKKGSLEEFLKNYNMIEYILEKYGTAFLNKGAEQYFQSKRKRIAKTKLVHILFNAEKIDSSLKDNLIELISFRNSIIHGSELYVSEEDVIFSKNVREELQTVLRVNLDPNEKPFL